MTLPPGLDGECACNWWSRRWRCDGTGDAFVSAESMATSPDAEFPGKEHEVRFCAAGASDHDTINIIFVVVLLGGRIFVASCCHSHTSYQIR
jgi:hypothetical protein